jgi:hypothetical protein
MNNLSEVYAGTETGPLPQEIVKLMVEMPIDPVTRALPGNEHDFGVGWFGMGLGVTSDGNSQGAWNKNGDLAGTSTFFQRNPDGAVWAATFNGRMDRDRDAYIYKLQSIIAGALENPTTGRSAAASTALPGARWQAPNSPAESPASRP